jgi:hypothetical protein
VLTGSKVAEIAGRGATRSSTRNVLEKFHTDLVRTSSNTIAKANSHQQLHKTLDIGYLRGDSKGGDRGDLGGHKREAGKKKATEGSKYSS